MSITGDLVDSNIVDGNQELIWELPALTRNNAKRKVKINARIKGFSNVTVMNVQRVGSTQLTGRTIYRVTIEVPR